MHIEPGVVDGAKMALAYATAAGAVTYGAREVLQAVRHSGVTSVALRGVMAAIGTLVFFELLPHFPVGLSEVHFILGTTLLLILGVGPAAIGLGAGLAIQGLVFAPTDLPMYAVNLTTLLVPLFAMGALTRRIVPAGTAYVDLTYAQVAKLSACYQGGIIAWVAFWAFYGTGVGALSSVASFAAAYMLVIVIEPIVDLGVLALAKAGRAPKGMVTPRLYG